MESAVRTKVSIRSGSVLLQGQLCLPEVARGLIVFSHCNTSHFQICRRVSAYLNNNGFGTFLFNPLLTQEVSGSDNCTFLGLVMQHLMDAAVFMQQFAILWQLPLGYFGTGAGTSAALKAARSLETAAVVCLGGPADLSDEEPKHIKAPTLLIAGSEDDEFTLTGTFNRLRCTKKFITLEACVADDVYAGAEIADFALEWFIKYCSVPVKY